MLVRLTPGGTYDELLLLFRIEGCLRLDLVVGGVSRLVNKGSRTSNLGWILNDDDDCMYYKIELLILLFELKYRRTSLSMDFEFAVLFIRDWLSVAKI